MVFRLFDRASSSELWSARALLCTMSEEAITTSGIRKSRGCSSLFRTIIGISSAARLRSILRQTGITPEELADLL